MVVFFCLKRWWLLKGSFKRLFYSLLLQTSEWSWFFSVTKCRNITEVKTSFEKQNCTTLTQSTLAVIVCCWKVILNQKWILCQDKHQIGLRRKGAHPSSSGESCADPTNQTGHQWSMELTEHDGAQHYTTLLIQYLSLQNKLLVEQRLPPRQGQQTVRHKLRRALGHVTRLSRKSFHNSALRSSAGENPATWIPNEDCCIP